MTTDPVTHTTCLRAKPLDLGKVRRDLDACDLGDASTAGAVLDIAEVLLVEVKRQRADLEDLASEHADLIVHVARLRNLLAEHGLEDPAWHSLNARQKQVLRDADAETLARAER